MQSSNPARIALLDVNVLIALLDPQHVHHNAAHHWFSSQVPIGWATCPLTQNGVLRILGNPRYPKYPRIPRDGDAASGWIVGPSSARFLAR